MGKLNLFSDLEISTFTLDNSARKFYHQFKEMNKFENYFDFVSVKM